MGNTIQFDISCPNNTWVFAAGKVANGTNIYGYRTFIRHFEEIIRWENSGDDYRKYGKQRFVINVSKETDTIANILHTYDQIIKPLGAKMVAIMPGIEDCEKGTPIGLFKQNLECLILKVLSEDQVPVVMTPYTILDVKMGEQLVPYIEVIREVAITQQIHIVDFYKIWSAKGECYIASRLSQDSILPNELGHLDMAKHLANGVGSKLSGDGAMSTIITMFKDSKNYIDLNKPCLIEDTTGTYKYIHKQIASGEPVTWLFIGDSITHGAMWTYGYDDFTELFEKRIRNEMGRIDDIIINTGVSGATTAEFLQNKDSRYFRYDADIVFIMLGMNDCVTLSLELFQDNLKQIIKEVRRRDGVPILMTPNVAPGRIHVLPPYIEVIRKVAKEKDVMLIDHFKEWKESATTPEVLESWVSAADSVMQIHPTSLGHLNMAKSIFKAIGIYDFKSPLCIMEYSNISIPNNKDE